jgi:amino acid adenylation domain-containing protein
MKEQDGLSRISGIPLSSSEARLWVLDRLHPHNPAYNLAAGIRLTGHIDAGALQAAFDEVLRRHEILRTEFNTIDGVPTQVVLPAARIALSIADLTDLSGQERELQLTRLAQQQAREAFDLMHGPLLRATNFRLSDAEYILVVVVHRIVCDETSAKLLLRELVQCYALFAKGKSPGSAKAPQPREVSATQAPPAAEQVSYWKQQLAGAPSSIDLPTDRPRRAVQTFDGAAQRILIDTRMLQQLRDLARDHGATLFTALLAGFNALLFRYSRQEDLVIGTPVSRRDRPDLENLIGPLENVVVLRTDLSGEPSFVDVLTRTRDVVQSAFSHQDVPFEALVEHLRLERDISRNPLFQIMFRLQDAAADAFQFPGHTLIPFEVETGTEEFDLSVRSVTTGDGLAITFSYNPDLFNAVTIHRMIGHFKKLLQEAVADPNRRASQLPILSKDEEEEILVEFNRTSADYPRDRCVHQLLEAQALRTPNAIAVEFNGQSLTYAELDSRSNQLAHLLRSHGVQRENLVGLCVERSLEMVVSLLGILKAGAAYVPLDPSYPADRIQYVLEDAHVRVLLTQKSLLKSLSVPETICLDPAWEFLTRQSSDPVGAEVSPENLAYTIYTSGSTGKPKGVQIEHRSVVNFLCSMQREPGLAANDVLLAVTTLSFDIAGLEMYLPLMTGARLVLASREQTYDGRLLMQLLEASKATVMQATPATWRLLFDSGWKRDSGLKILVGGEALPADLAQDLARCGSVWNMYGPTETTIWSTVHRIDGSDDRTVSIGKPIANTQAYILDGNENPVPIGVPGELYLGGDGLARGYFGRPDLTAERFVRNPFILDPGARMYRTGDLARFLPDGNILYLGRIDNQVKIRGFRIELGEIESVLAQCPSVQSAVVVAHEDAIGGKRLVAYIVPSSPQEFSIPGLRDFLKQRLPEYMIPNAFIKMATLPLTPNGKIDRRALPPPEILETESVASNGARDDLELQLLNIWRKILAAPQLGVTDNFFEFGGHSLLAARLLSEVEKATGKVVPLSALFRGATVESLAQWIRTSSGTEHDPIAMKIQAGGEGLPFFALVAPGEESLGYAMLARHMGSGQTFYKIQGYAPIVGQNPYTEQQMQTLATEYAAAIQSVQPEGPYCLGGLCDGVHIGERVVLELESRGQQVALFAIIDTWVLQNSQRRWLWRISYLQQRLREARRRGLSERLQLYKQAGTNRIQRLLGKAQARTDWRDAYWPTNYTPTRFRAPVILFKRPKQPYYYVKDPQMGWGARTTGPMEIHEIDFDHLNLLREPHVGVLGKKLAACMARVGNRRGDAHEIEDSLATQVPASSTNRDLKPVSK